MGGAKSLFLMDQSLTALQTIGHIAEVCKALGYRGTQTAHWPQIFQTTVAFLLDANTLLRDILIRMQNNKEAIPAEAYSALVSRLEWISAQYSKIPGLDASQTTLSLQQNDVDDLIQKLLKANE